jgi:2-polyprenyl-3-methyl-5-hydroxy-6-metoxy-1,4-benzoquinol methylase
VSKCRMCLSSKYKTIYSSPIRKGGGKERVNDHSILRCEDCNFVYLSPIPEQSNDFYESHEYRKQWDYEFTPDSIHVKYDHEQNERIIRIGIENIRGKSVLDLGASAGVFLDAISSSAASTIAIEPALMYKEYLQSQGHTYYSYPEDACRENEKVDIVTSFDVIEHVEKPKEFLSYAYELLKPGGKLVLSMPNLNDIIKKVEKDKFEQFFYQTAHLNYFSKEAIPELFCDTGFVSIEVDFLHKYSIENMIRWAKYGSVGVVEEVDGVFDRIFDKHYKAEIERLGIASHLFITAERPL